MTAPVISPPHALFAPLRDRPRLIAGIVLDRNWHPGPDPVWSRSQNATLAVAAEVFPEPVPLILRLSVFGASPETPRQLTVTSPGQPDLSLRISTPAPVSLVMTTPMHEPGHNHTAVELTLDTLTSPAKAGLSTDERLLGLRLWSVDVQTSVVTLPVDFTHGPSPLLAQGWAEVEPGVGVWSLGHEAKLVLPGYLRGAFTETLCLEADVLERPSTAPPLEIEVFCNGVYAAQWRFPETAMATLHCPLSGWYESADCTLKFRMTNVMSPAELCLSADVRPLGLLLRRIPLPSGKA